MTHYLGAIKPKSLYGVNTCWTKSRAQMSAGSGDPRAPHTAVPAGPWAWPEALSQSSHGSGLLSLGHSPRKAMLALQWSIAICLLYCLVKRPLTAPNLLSLLDGSHHLPSSAKAVHMKRFLLQAFLNPFLCSRRGLSGQVKWLSRNSEAQQSRAWNSHADFTSGGNEQVRNLHHQMTQFRSDGKDHQKPRVGKANV